MQHCRLKAYPFQSIPSTKTALAAFAFFPDANSVHSKPSFISHNTHSLYGQDITQVSRIIKRRDQFRFQSTSVVRATRPCIQWWPCRVCPFVNSSVRMPSTSHLSHQFLISPSNYCRPVSHFRKMSVVEITSIRCWRPLPIRPSCWIHYGSQAALAFPLCRANIILCWHKIRHPFGLR